MRRLKSVCNDPTQTSNMPDMFLKDTRPNGEYYSTFRVSFLISLNLWKTTGSEERSRKSG